MAVTILERPEGHIIRTNVMSGTTFSFGGLLHVSTTEDHGLSTNDTILISSDVSEYNGYRKVGTVAGPTVFAVETLDGVNINFIDITSVTFTYVGIVGLASDFAGNFHIITNSAHGLTVGDVVYITSNIEEYNGFKKVGTVAGPNNFAVEYFNGTNVPFMQGIYLSYNPNLYTHGWSCVHLPIVYRLSNDIYPVNSSDTTRNINSVQNAHGYTVILLSGSLGTAINSYDFVKLALPNDTELSGVYQILEFISPTVMIINLAYDSDNNFSSATALKHYNNYNIVVRIYVGINSAHEWASQKPYELAATKEFTPDDNNEAFFSIHDILQSYIETKNNLILGTLPNNIDFWANFYIEVAESYDDSDGYSFGTFTSNFTSDQSTFEGSAANAKLEFKNVHSGYLSEYVMFNDDSKFLTFFDEPVLFEGIYQDISFIKLTYADYILVKQWYSNGDAGLLETETISGGPGIYRIQLEANCAYDRLDLSLLVNVNVEAETAELILTGNTPTVYTGPPT